MQVLNDGVDEEDFMYMREVTDFIDKFKKA